MNASTMRSHTISISRGTITLQPNQISAVASEFLGSLRESVGPDIDEYTLVFRSKANAEAFLNAVSGFAPQPPSAPSS